MTSNPSDNQVREITNPPTQTVVSRNDQKLAAYDRRKIEHLADEINKLNPEERKKVLRDLRETFKEETASANDIFLIEKMSIRAFRKGPVYNTHNSSIGPDLATAYDDSTCRKLKEKYGTEYKFVELVKQISFRTQQNNKLRVADNICIKQ